MFQLSKFLCEALLKILVNLREKNTPDITLIRIVNELLHITSHSLLTIVGDNNFFCSTLSEFENFLLCERILIKLTTCQNETSS
jgi:hypothetical protein